VHHQLTTISIMIGTRANTLSQQIELCYSKHHHNTTITDTNQENITDPMILPTTSHTYTPPLPPPNIPPSPSTGHTNDPDTPLDIIKPYAMITVNNPTTALLLLPPPAYPISKHDSSSLLNSTQSSISPSSGSLDSHLTNLSNLSNSEDHPTSSQAPPFQG